MSADSISQRSLRALRWVGIGAAARALSQVVVQITLARLLGPEAFGQFALIMTMIGLGFMLADLGLGAALIQKPELQEGDVAFALGWMTLAALVWAVLLVVLAPQWSRLLGTPEAASMSTLAAAVVLLMTWRNVAWSLLRRDIRFRASQMIDLGAYLLVFGGVSVALALKGFGAWSLLIGQASQVLVSLVATYAICRHPLRMRLAGDKSLLRFGLGALGNDLMAWTANSLDRVLIGRNWGMDALGFYAMAYNLVRAPTTLAIEALQGLIFASSSRMQQDLYALGRGFLLAVSALMVVTTPGMLLVAMEGQPLIELVFGDAWRPAAPMVAALALSVPCLAAAALCASVLRGTGAVGTEFRLQAAGSLLLLGGLLALASWPLAQAVWWITAATAVRAAMLAAAVLLRLQVRAWDLIQACRGAWLLSAAVVLAVLASRQFETAGLSGQPWLSLLAGAGTGAALVAFRPRSVFGAALSDYLHGQLAGRPAWGWFVGRLAA